MSRRLVLDASAAVRVVLRDAGSGPLRAELEAAALVLAPSIYVSEVANALRKYAAKAGELSTDECSERLGEAELLVDEVFDDRELVLEALHQAVAHDHPVDDLLYAVLARRTGAAVLTLDRRLAALLDTLRIPHRGA